MQTIHWGMLLSHHPPSQYDRTFLIGRVRVCARCSGVLLGSVALWVFNLFFDYALWVHCLIVVFSPLPAVLNFSRSELALVVNKNWKRIASGFVLGFAVGEFFCPLIGNNQAHWIVSLAVFFYLFLLAFLVVVFLRKGGRMEALVAEYEKGIYLRDSPPR